MDVYSDVKITENRLEELGITAKRWLCAHGAVTYKIDQPLCYPVPVSLFPIATPRSHFQEIIALQPYVNRLVHQASLDHEFIKDALKQ